MTVSVREQVRDFLAPHFGRDALHDDDDIFAVGHATSLFAHQLLAFVQSHGVRVASRDLDIAHFRSIDALVALITEKADHADRVGTVGNADGERST